MIFRKFFLMNFLVNITKDWLIWFNFFWDKHWKIADFYTKALLFPYVVGFKAPLLHKSCLLAGAYLRR